MTHDPWAPGLKYEFPCRIFPPAFQLIDIHLAVFTLKHTFDLLCSFQLDFFKLNNRTKDKDGLDLFEICFFLSRVDGLRMHWGEGKLGRGPLLTNSLAAYKLSCKDTAPLSWYYLLFHEIMKQNIWPVHTTNYFARKRHLFHGIIFLIRRKYYNHRS